MEYTKRVEPVFDIIAQPTVSKHLRVLCEASFVDAQRRLYRMKRLWSAHVDALDHMESVNTNEKEDNKKTTRPKPRT